VNDGELGQDRQEDELTRRHRGGERAKHDAAARNEPAIHNGRRKH